MRDKLELLFDERAMRSLAERYAQGADRRDKAIWAAILAEDCVIEGPGFSLRGRAQCLTAIDRLAAMFTSTRHNITGQTVSIEGDGARGETYCVADHLVEEDGERFILSWHIRYQDKWQRTGEDWQFSERKLILDWEEKRALRAGETA